MDEGGGGVKKLNTNSLVNNLNDDYNGEDDNIESHISRNVLPTVIIVVKKSANIRQELQLITDASVIMIIISC